MVSMDTLTFALFTNRLLFIDTRDVQHPETYILPKGSVGTALGCRDNLVYLARNTAAGGVIDVLTGS
jgi:hypothetical protein